MLSKPCICHKKCSDQWHPEPDILTCSLPPYITAFKQRHPDVDIEIKIDSSIQRQWLDDNIIDFGITDYYNSQGLEWLPLAKDTFYAAVHANSPLAYSESISLDELLEYPILLPTQNPNSFTIRALSGRKINKHIDIATTNTHTLLLLVQQGLGSALISKYYLEDVPLSVKMIPLFPPLEREIGIIARSFDNMNPLAKEFIQMMHSQLNA